MEMCERNLERGLHLRSKGFGPISKLIREVEIKIVRSQLALEFNFDSNRQPYGN